jgi:hypothetical protein
MTAVGKKIPRTADMQFSWLTRQYGSQWAPWSEYAAEWMALQEHGLDARLHALRTLFEKYLIKLDLPAAPSRLLSRAELVPDLYEVACPKSVEGVKYNNCIQEFLQWVLERHFSKPDEHGRPVQLPDYHNPVRRRSRSRLMSPVETVRTPLPYRFIRDLREILAPGRHFRDWLWAIQAREARQKGGGGRYGDWYEVDPARVDPNDPDCVFRARTVIRDNDSITITQLWSPVRSAALLVKLTLPLRTYQVRMLDSGEADTWRYSACSWALNKTPLAGGDLRQPIRRGVFRRVEDPDTRGIYTALYINTNKTADIGKDGNDLGYVIPWQHEQLLYWLEKLRNWQEKYNPIDALTSWDELEVKHLGQTKSELQLRRLPDACFLFRNPAAKADGRAKPITADSMRRHWYDLLLELENRCASRGETLPDGQRLKFVEAWEASNDGQKTFFPLHTLRVSLLTSLALDAEVPLVVLSKLVAGHCRLLMTLYYTKISVLRMTDVLNDASAHLAASADQGLQRFLAEASYEQLASGVIANDEAGLHAALPSNRADRNPVGWMARHYGLCLVGGNTSPVAGYTRLGGCFNGGGRFRADHGGESIDHLPVPGGAGNCVRCRWFVTEPHYLDALRAHFNNVSYHLGEETHTAQTYEQRLNALAPRRLEAERQGVLFTAQDEYRSLERLWESSLAKVDQYANDLTATFRLIKRCYALIQQQRTNADSPRQLVAVGGLQDLRIAFEDIRSELLQLSEVCLDVELYPDEQSGKAIVRRSQLLDSALYRDGMPPVFMALSEAEQLHLGNRFIRHLANVTDAKDPQLGLRKVVGLMDTGRSLKELGLLDETLNWLSHEVPHPMGRLAQGARARAVTPLEPHY